MQRREHFGHRAAPPHDVRRAQAVPAEAEPAGLPRPVAVNLGLRTADAELERELDEWKAARKLRSRSFREPWRSLSIVAAAGFGIGEWLLPDSVAQIADTLTVCLFAASLYAGLRKR